MKQVDKPVWQGVSQQIRPPSKKNRYSYATSEEKSLRYSPEQSRVDNGDKRHCSCPTGFRNIINTLTADDTDFRTFHQDQTKKRKFVTRALNFKTPTANIVFRHVTEIKPKGKSALLLIVYFSKGVKPK